MCVFVYLCVYKEIYLKELAYGEEKPEIHGVLSFSCAGPSQSGGILAHVLHSLIELYLIS